MKHRPIQLVCLALLLSTLRLADASAFAPGVLPLQAGLLRAILFTHAAETHTPSPRIRPDAPRLRTTYVIESASIAPKARTLPVSLPASSHRATTLPWTMRPPSEHSAALESRTGFRRL